jgi:DNA-binding NtrC family response regulator
MGQVKALTTLVARVSVCDEPVCAVDATEPLLVSMQLSSLAEAREQFEREYLRSLLNRCGQNIQQAAKHAGISRQALYALLARRGLWPRDEARRGELRERDSGAAGRRSQPSPSGE